MAALILWLFWACVYSVAAWGVILLVYDYFNPPPKGPSLEEIERRIRGG